MGATMMALVKEYRASGLCFKQVPIPAIGPNDVLIKVRSSSICGTDMHIYKWDAWAENTVVTPNVVGHEFAGIVEAVGSEVTNVRAGDYVSAEGHVVCGVCRACRSGNAHVCPHTRSFGITIPGCFAEYAVVPATNIVHNDPRLPAELACLQDPLGNAVQSVMAGDITGKSVAVIGAGPIGLMAVAVAKACGASSVIAADINDFRLRMAKTMGADALVNSATETLSQRLKELTGGEGVEVLLEMSGHPEAIRQGLEGTANAGRVSLLGIPAGSVELDLSRSIIFKGLRIEGITGRRMYTTWFQVKGLLESGRIDLSPLVTHRFRLDQYEEAFELMRSGNCGKIVFIHE
ncbi:L-threonine 3-dehydrogenase [Paenibacillus ginsengarvi]|uniref:L-threonine 3-dehydrogenase n=1 Tax=Paenibacillus ginsengarvi TaxID=400777 RepID=A0A3B0BRQ3_9BACL|nr:L-threonine 3-dehydrogenase [Paenibacillus ginsengarvi]RKN76015.1 L-threonine 3-dehydrogenase [Paenibacillus ginsengarvi]